MPLSSRPRLRLMLAIALAQLVFWVGLGLIGERTRELSDLRPYAVAKMQAAPIAGLVPDPDVRHHAPAQDFPLTPSGRRCQRGYDSPAWQVSFDITLAPERLNGAWALYFPWVSDNAKTYLNGQLLTHPRGLFSLTPSREERTPFLYDIPPSMLEDGINQIDMIVVRKGCMPYVETAFFAPLDQVRAYDAHMRGLGLWVPVATGLAALIIALVAVCLLPLSGYSGFLIALSGFMIVLALRAFDFMWQGNGVDYTTFLVARYALYFATLAAAAVFVMAWAGQSARHFTAIAGLYGAIVAVMAAIWWTEGDMWNVIHSLLSPLALLMLTAYVAFCLRRMSRLQPEVAARGAVLLSVCLTAEIYDMLVVIFDWRRFIDAGYYLPVVLIIGLSAELMIRGYQLYHAAAAARDSLAQQVAEKEAEIRRSYAELRAQEAVNTINEERQRLIRDMHDGVGGQLVSLMLQLRGVSVSAEGVRAQIQAALDDLRLIIDSMDSVGDSLEVALAIFRERMAPRLRAAGITLVWQNTIGHDVDGFRPQQILNLYRILQEGVTNALKYSGASEIRLSLEVDDARPGHLKVTLADNGCGFDAETHEGTGRGLSHMRKRARQLEADFNLTTAPGGGVTLRLSLPRPSRL